MTRVDPVVAFDWGGGSPDPAIGPDTFSVRWTGQVQPQFSETYSFTCLTDDGFRLAEEDLRLRGPGDFIGVRQSGMPELRMADLSDTKLIELSRSLAAKLWQSDPYLRKPEHGPLRERMHLFWQSFMAH